MTQMIPAPPGGSGGFPPIADYAYLSDCETAALIAPSGNVEWMCAPRMDSPSLFAAILDCEPAFDYGGLAAEWRYTEAGYHAAAASSEGMEIELRLVTDMRLGLEGPRAKARTILQEGDVAFAALGWADYPLPQTYEEASDRLERTAHYWQEWLKHGSFPDHPWRTYLQRSALTLKGLTYAPTGAMIAAPTTSLPETPGGERNWDYRYSWIRDSTFMLWALYTLGFDWE